MEAVTPKQELSVSLQALAEAVPAAQLFERQSGLGFTEEANDHLYGIALLMSNLIHVGIGLKMELLLKAWGTTQERKELLPCS